MKVKTLVVFIMIGNIAGLGQKGKSPFSKDIVTLFSNKLLLVDLGKNKNFDTTMQKATIVLKNARSDEDITLSLQVENRFAFSGQQLTRAQVSKKGRYQIVQYSFGNKSQLLNIAFSFMPGDPTVRKVSFKFTPNIKELFTYEWYTLLELSSP